MSVCDCLFGAREETAVGVDKADDDVPMEEWQGKEEEEEEEAEEGAAEPEEMTRESSSPDMEEEISTLSFEGLKQMALDFFSQATELLSPDVAARANEKEAQEIGRMNTLELREHVVALGSNQRAVEEVEEDGEATSDEVAEARRYSLFDPSDEFDPEAFAKFFEDAVNDDSTVNAKLFVEGAKQVPVLMGGLGRAFEFAMADLNNKLHTAEKRIEETAKDLGKDVAEVTLQDMVERDVRKKLTHAGKKSSPASRTILRLLWFTEFVGALLREIAENPDQDLKSSASKVYERTLGPRHRWILKKLARAGMRLVPPKKTFQVRLKTSDLTLSEEKEKLQRIYEAMEEVDSVMWAFMKSKGLDVLP